MEGYDAFSAGVEFGGLVSTTQIKALIGYLLRELDAPLSADGLRRVLTEQGLANYFDVSEALSELVRTGNVTREPDGERDMLSLTQRGRIAVHELEPDIPKSVREKAFAAALAQTVRERNAQQTQINVESAGEGFNVTFRFGEAVGDSLLRVQVYAADQKQVERMKSNFLDDPAKFYSGILASLLI